MGFIQKIRRHAAIASGDFNAMFKDVEIPPLPLAVQRLFAEINKEDPDIDELAKMISAETGIASKVIKTVNSAYYSPRSPVTEVKQAVMFLGLKNIRSLTTAFAVMDALPNPKGGIFDHEAFWIDSLLRAFLSRSFTNTRFKHRGQEAFTASLISDVALPILLSVWQEYYTPIVKTWLNSPKHLSVLEREQFGWDHGQAGAWIVQSWGFPDELVCCIGAHNLTLSEIQNLELADTIVVPMALAAMVSSVLKHDPNSNYDMYMEAVKVLEISQKEFGEMLDSIKNEFNEMLSLFGLTDRGALDTLDQLISYTQQDN